MMKYSLQEAHQRLVVHSVSYLRAEAMLRMLTHCAARFKEICSDAGKDAHKLKQVASYSESAGCNAWVVGKLMTESDILHYIPLGSVIVDYAVPHIPEHIAAKYCYVNGAALEYDSRDTDLTFCHDVPGTMPSCLAATIIHAREDLGQHECGEIDIDEVEPWWNKAAKHGFHLKCISSMPSAIAKHQVEGVCTTRARLNNFQGDLDCLMGG